MKNPDSMSCTIKKKAGTYNCYTVTFKGLTRGSILALNTALANHAARGSACANDVRLFLENGIEHSGDLDLRIDTRLET